MVEKKYFETPFYSSFCPGIDIRNIERGRPLYTRGPLNAWTGACFLIFQIRSAVSPDRFCNVFLTNAGVFDSTVCLSINPSDDLRTALRKYRLGLPADQARSFPALSEILTPGTPAYFDGEKVHKKLAYKHEISARSFLSEEMARQAAAFATFIEQAYTEASVLLGNDIRACENATSHKLPFYSSTDLHLPLHRQVESYDFNYCEYQRSLFQGSKFYIFQFRKDDRFFTFYLVGSASAIPKCRLHAEITDSWLQALSNLIQLYWDKYDRLPVEFKTLCPTITELLQQNDAAGRPHLLPYKLTLTTDIIFPREMNRAVPDDVFAAMPSFADLLRAIAAELRAFISSDFYSYLCKRAGEQSKKENKKSIKTLGKIIARGFSLLNGGAPIDFHDWGAS